MREDKNGNVIGNGDYHVNYTVYDMPDGVEIHVSESISTESVYVTYQYQDKKVTVRFSWHENNAVKFGDQLNGYLTNDYEVLALLGLKKRTFVPQTYLNIEKQCVAKKNLHLYDEAALTIQEMYALGAGANISQYTGKLAKGSNYLINGSMVELCEKTSIDSLGRIIRFGIWKYED